MIELSSGLVPRKIGEALVLLPVAPHGFFQGNITFFHTTSDCSGDRYLGNNGGVFAYLGQMSGGTVFYTTLTDPLSTPTQTVNAMEIVKPGDNLGVIGECIQSEMGDLSVGRAIAVTDPAINALAPPFRLR